MKSIYKLLIVLGALLVIYLVIELTENEGRSESIRSILVSIDTSRVTTMQISNPANSVNLTKKNGQWYVETSMGMKKAVRSDVENTLSSLQTIRPSRLVSRSKDKWQEFTVDSTGVRVLLQGGDENLLDIIVGRFGMSDQRSFYTYVRLSDENDVYAADNFMSMSISTDPDNFRNDRIVQLDSDSLSKIVFNYLDSSFVAEKELDGWFIEENPADSASFANYLKDLSSLSSTSFANQEDLASSDISVVYEFTNRSPIELSALKNSMGWIIQSSENEDEVWIDEEIFSKIFVGQKGFLHKM